MSFAPRGARVSLLFKGLQFGVQREMWTNVSDKQASVLLRAVKSDVQYGLFLFFMWACLIHALSPPITYRSFLDNVSYLIFTAINAVNCTVFSTLTFSALYNNNNITLFILLTFRLPRNSLCGC